LTSHLDGAKVAVIAVNVLCKIGLVKKKEATKARG